MVFKVHRAWKTRNNWRLETEKVVVAAGVVSSGREMRSAEPALQIGFAIDAAGGGASRVVVSIPPCDFTDLVRMMMKANPDAALKAFDVAREADFLMRFFRKDPP